MERNKVWQDIVEKNPDLIPYSLRHRFAHQCHKGSANPISVKDASEAMGHLPDTHMTFYARYTTELAIEKAFERHSDNRIKV